MDLAEAILLLIRSAWGILWFLISSVFLAVWFPVLTVAFLCLIDWKAGGFRHPVPFFIFTIISCAAWSAVGFRIDRARFFHDTDWLVFTLGFVASCTVWLLYSSKMDIVRRSRHLRDRTFHKHGGVEPELE